MSAEGSQHFVSWEEQIVCSDRGRRLVHFYMKKASGESMLSVIGTERSIRHMLYVGTDELLQTCGNHRLIKPSMKWRARREVVDLLNSLVSGTYKLTTCKMIKFFTNFGLLFCSLLPKQVSLSIRPWTCHLIVNFIV